MLYPLCEVAFIETNPVPIKEAMNMCGMPAGEVRLPLCSLQEEHKVMLEKILINMGILE